MKEMFSISSGINVAKSKPTVTSSKEVGSSEKTSSSKDFLSVMFAQVKESLQMSEGEEKLAIKLDTPTEEIKIDLSDKGSQKSIDEHLLEDVLKVVSLLKNPDDKTISFPSFSNKLEKIINNENVLKELKEVNNITDLLKLSKKYDLGLEKISVKKLDIETLQKEFPTLDKKEFFGPQKEITAKVEKAPVEVKKDVEVKPTVMTIRDMEKTTTEAKKEPTLFEKMMSTPKEEVKTAKPEALHVDKETLKDKTVDVKTVNEKIITEKTIDTKILNEKIIVDKTIEKKEEIGTKITEEVKKAVKVVQEEAPKVIVKEEQKEVKTKVVKEDLHVKVEKEVKTPETTRVVEPKIESNIPKKGLIEDILQGIKTNKPINETKASVASVLNTESTKTENVTSETSEVKTEPITTRTELKTQIKTENPFTKQGTTPRETFNNFANDLKEKMENYKPPVMRVQMALNPKGLGEVDVVVVNRGNNLHVNISSNTNTMTLFTQNQAEFKNSLVNMGFTNLEMNFSDQRESKEQQHSNKSSKEFNENFEDENIEEETNSIELVVPQYV